MERRSFFGAIAGLIAGLVAKPAATNVVVSGAVDAETWCACELEPVEFVSYRIFIAGEELKRGQMVYGNENWRVVSGGDA